MGTGICVAAAPALLSVLCIDWGRTGWILFGAILLTAGLAVEPVARWAQRSTVRSSAQLGASTSSTVEHGLPINGPRT
jgi:hypothetical protein